MITFVYWLCFILGLLIMVVSGSQKQQYKQQHGEVPKEKKKQFRMRFFLGLCIVFLGSGIRVYDELKAIDEKYAEPESQPLNVSAVIENNYKEKFDNAILNDSINLFVSQCIGLNTYRDYVEHVEFYASRLDNNDPVFFYNEEYGWINHIEVTIKIFDDKNLIIEDEILTGNNLFYYIGGDDAPGIRIRKDVSALFFGLGKNEFVSGKDTFIPLEEFKIIDDIFNVE